MIHFEFEDLIGETFSKIEGKIFDTQMVFYTNNSKFTLADDFAHKITIKDIVGDLDDLIGCPILFAEESFNEDFTFYKLATIKGSVTISWFDDFSQHYSIQVSLSKDIITYEIESIHPEDLTGYTITKIDELYNNCGFVFQIDDDLSIILYGEGDCTIKDFHGCLNDLIGKPIKYFTDSRCDQENFFDQDEFCYSKSNLEKRKKLIDAFIVQEISTDNGTVTLFWFGESKSPVDVILHKRIFVYVQ